jgi:hypothetical protein
VCPLELTCTIDQFSGGVSLSHATKWLVAVVVVVVVLYHAPPLVNIGSSGRSLIVGLMVAISGLVETPEV